MPAVAQSGVNFAGAVMEIDGVVVGKLTSYQKQRSIDEQEVSGSGDIVGTAPNKITSKKFKPVAIGKTASIELVYLTNDQGQSDLLDAADTGMEVQIRFYRQDGQGYLQTGYFTGTTEKGSLGNIFTISGDFRVNDESVVTGTAS